MAVEAARARPVDLEHLARYTGGDTALNGEILGLFLDQSAGLMKQLDEALKMRDQKSWHDIMHSLKGAARGIGAFPMADAAAQAEPIALSASDAAVQALDALKARARPVQLFIEAYLGR
jgi:HPt (histidine-containing phosphotransfer) domain-containing protein